MIDFEFEATIRHKIDDLFCTTPAKIEWLIETDVFKIAIAQDGDISGLTAMVTSGGFALTSHGAKASVRALINMSPEPFSNWIASVTEDGAAVGMSSMALANPAAAAVLALIFGGFALLTVVVLWRFLRRIRRRILERFRGGWRITGAPPVSAT